MTDIARAITNLRPDQSGDLCCITVRERGGLLRDLQHHCLAYIPGEGEAARHLVITFGNLATSREAGPIMPWGYAFLANQGWSVLGVINKRNDWLREPEVLAALADLRDSGFYRSFDRISAYGSSMGGYAALALAPLFPGANAVAFAPQSTLDRRLAPFERRYPYAHKLVDWSDPTSDGQIGVQALAGGTIFFDPFVPEDRAHAARLTRPGVQQIALRHCGHALPPVLRRMGLLQPLAVAALRGELTQTRFAQIYRARREAVRYLDLLLEAAEARGHLILGERAAQGALERVQNWKIRKRLRSLRAAQPKV